MCFAFLHAATPRNSKKCPSWQQLADEKIREAAAATAVRFPILGARIVKPAKGKVEFQIWAPPAPVTVEARDFAALPDPGKGADSTGVSDFQRAMEGEFAIPLGGSSNGSTEVFQVSWRRQVAFSDSSVDFAPVEAAPPALPPPMDELLPKSYRAKGLLTKLVDSAGYVAGAKRALLPFEPGCADHKKNAFRTEFLPFSLGPQASPDALVLREFSAAHAAYRWVGFALGLASSEGPRALETDVAHATERAVAATEKLLDACARESATLFGAECAAALKAYLEPALPPSAVGLYDTGLPMAERVSATMAFWDVARSLSSAAAADVAKGRHFSEIPTLNMLFSQVHAHTRRVQVHAHTRRVQVHAHTRRVQALKHPSLTPESSLRTSVLSGFTDAPQEATWKDVGQLAIRETFGPLASIHGVGPCIALPDLLQLSTSAVHLWSVVSSQPTVSQCGSTDLPLRCHLSLLQALKHPSLTPESSLRTSVLSGFTDAPQEATWKDVGQLAIRETFGPLASIHGVGPCIALPDLLQDGDLHVTLVYAAPLFSRATMREIASTMKVNLLAAAGV
eukprot:jgi/Mesen1/7459/ME000389S06801